MTSTVGYDALGKRVQMWHAIVVHTILSIIRMIPLQLVFLRTAGDLRELGLRDAGHEPLQAAKCFSHLLFSVSKVIV